MPEKPHLLEPIAQAAAQSSAFQKTERVFIEKTLLQMYPRLQYRDLHPWKLWNGPLIPDFIINNTDPSIRRIVEIGCGDGVLSNTLALLYPEIEVIGIDPDPNKIFRARKTIGIRKNLKFVCGNAAIMADITCDQIIYNRCLTWYEKPQAYKTMIAKTLRWLRPGGDWIVRESPLSLLFSPVFWKYAYTEMEQAKSVEAYLQGMFADMGYRFPATYAFNRLPWIPTEVFYRLPKELERNHFPTGPRKLKLEEWQDVDDQSSDAVLGFLFSNSTDNLLQELL